MKKTSLRTSKKNETSNEKNALVVEPLTKDDLKALRTNVKAGIPRRCCEAPKQEY